MYGLKLIVIIFMHHVKGLFQPSLKAKQSLFYTNNDGCVIARSAEAKALGIPMGEPAFKLKELIES